MKIKFGCNNCLESFHIQSAYLVEKEAIICPNCASVYPEESFEQLKQGVASIVNSRSNMKLEDTKAGYTPKFNFSIID